MSINTADLQAAVTDLAEIRSLVAEAIRLKGQSGGLIAKAAAEIASGRFMALHGQVVEHVLGAVLQASVPAEPRQQRQGETLRAAAH